MTTNELTKIWAKISGLFARKTEVATKADKAALRDFCPIIEDTRSSVVVNITGVAPFSELVSGQRICLHLKYGTAYNATLQLTLSGGTQTSAIAIYYSQQEAYTVMRRIRGTSCASGMYIDMVYDGSSWIVNGFGDANTQYNTITQAEITAGTSDSTRVVTPKLLVDNFDRRHLYVDNSADASVELSVATYNDLGTLSAWKPVTLPAAYNRGDEFIFRFVCGDADLSPVLPQGVVLADGFDFSEIAAGVVYQVSIMDDVAAYLVLTPNA